MDKEEQLRKIKSKLAKWISREPDHIGCVVIGKDEIKELNGDIVEAISGRARDI